MHNMLKFARTHNFLSSRNFEMVIQCYNFAKGYEIWKRVGGAKLTVAELSSFEFSSKLRTPGQMGCHVEQNYRNCEVKLKAVGK